MKRESSCSRTLRWAVPGLLSVLFVFSCMAMRAYADTYGYEFRPGPNAPAGFRPGPGVDASGLDLSGSAFVGMDLSNANFERCNLQRVFFAQVRFQQGSASFREADLRYARFAETPHSPKQEGLDECDFTDALIQGLQFTTQYAHLTIDQIRSTKSFKMKDLSGCQIVGGVSDRKSYSFYHLRPRPVEVDFRQFDLRNATFAAGDFTNSQFAGAIIRGCTFFKSNISPDQIASTSRYVPDAHVGGFPDSFFVTPDHFGMLTSRSGYAGLGFAHMDLSSWNFAKADLRGTRLCDVNLTGVDFSGADISEAHFSNSISKDQLVATTSYQTGDLAGIVFARLDLSSVDFSRQNLTRSIFVLCDLSGADFTDAIITSADFASCIHPLLTLDQIKSTWNYKHGRMEGIRLPEELAEALRQEKDAGPSE